MRFLGNTFTGKFYLSHYIFLLFLKTNKNNKGVKYTKKEKEVELVGKRVEEGMGRKGPSNGTTASFSK